jgi:Tol biopolymer transport system component
MLVFVSTADNLVSGDTNGTADVFVRDLAAGVTRLVSVNTNGVSGGGVSTTPVISGDGRRVAFASAAPDLVTNDFNGFNDVFIRDLQLGVTRLVSEGVSGVSANRLSFGPAISPDGFAVAFVSQATDLLPVTDTNLQTDVYLRDVLFNTNALVSVKTTGVTGNAGSSSPVFSADGRNVLFVSIATDLAANDNNGRQDVFLWSRSSGTTELVSVNAAGNGTANGLSGITAACISADNRHVSFFSQASDLVAGNADTNGVADVFVRDRQSGVTRLLSFNPTTGRVADGPSFSPFISGEGRTVVFATDARNLLEGDLNKATDIVAVDVTNAMPSSLTASGFVEAPGESPAGIKFPVTVRVLNDGAETIEGLRLANPLSEGVRRLAASFSSGQFDAASGEWTLGALPPRAEATLALTVCADVEGVAKVGGELSPPRATLNVAGRDRDLALVRVLPAPRVEFQDYATYRGDIDHPWLDELTNGLTRRFAPGGAAPAGVSVEAYGAAYVLRFDPDVLGALPSRVGIVWSGVGVGLNADVYDWKGRRIGRRSAPAGGSGQRLFAIDHWPGIAWLTVYSRGTVEEFQVATHAGVPAPRGLVFEATGAETGDLAAGRVGAGYDCAGSEVGFFFPGVMPGPSSFGCVPMPLCMRVPRWRRWSRCRRAGSMFGMNRVSFERGRAWRPVLRRCFPPGRTWPRIVGGT